MSRRIASCGRFAYAVNEYISPYIGAYWEHEFDGKQRATVNGVGIGSPSLKGDTGMGELGLTLKPSQTPLLSFDLGVQGYVGKREGLTGTLRAKWEF
jgi:outer membrane autotransporter protein